MPTFNQSSSETQRPLSPKERLNSLGTAGFMEVVRPTAYVAKDNLQNIVRTVVAPEYFPQPVYDEMTSFQDEDTARKFGRQIVPESNQEFTGV